MTPQEIFDTVAKHLFAQGHRSINFEPAPGYADDAVCQYRAPDGSRCAVGALMSDDLYNPEFEGKGIEGLVNEDHNKLIYQFPTWMRDNLYLLRDLQRVHDGPSSWETTSAMQAELKSVARFHNLSTEVLEGLSFNRENVDDLSDY